MKFKSLLAAATLSLAAFGATATPQYFGDSTGTGITAPYSGASGYYIWNDAVNTNKWSIRWTDTSGLGIPEDQRGPSPEWEGSVVFETSNLESAMSFSFEQNDLLTVEFNNRSADEFDWVSSTNTIGHIDGIDFTIDGFVETMEFNLGSTLFAGIGTNTTDPGIASVGIFIGDDEGAPNVLTVDYGDFATQSFEIHVAAPGALALMGLSVFGLAFASRRRSK